MQDLLQVILVLITLIGLFNIGLYANKIARAAYKAKKYGSEYDLYGKLFIRGMALIAINLVVSFINLQSNVVELIIITICIVFSIYLLFQIIKLRKTA